MRVHSIRSERLPGLWHLSAAPGGGVESIELPILTAEVDRLPGQLAGLLLAADLQGMAPVATLDGASDLLGIALADHMVQLADAGEAPPASELGVLLAGDLFSAPQADKRGATGDVRPVWLAFRSEMRWVAGVAGNHDLFGKDGERQRFASQQGIYWIDGQVVEVDGLRIGGVGGIIGTSGKPGRREEEDFLSVLESVLAQRPEILVLHQGPSGPGDGQSGHESVKAALEARSDGPLVICGHVHWPQPLAELRSGVQVLNVDGTALVLQRFAG